MKDKYEGIPFTDEEKEIIGRYSQYVQNKRWQTMLAPHYAQVDEQFPGLDDAERTKLANALYGKVLAKRARSRWVKVEG